MSSGFVLLSRLLRFQPARFWLPEGVTRIGRSRESDLVIRNHTVSRQHAEIRIAGQSASIRDLGSANGTFLAGQPIDESPLKCGQEVRFGHVGFLFSYVDPQDPDSDSDEETYRLNEEDAKGSQTIVIDGYMLSPARRQVLEMLLDGFPEKRVARIMRVTQETVHSHVKAIYRACGVHSRAELLALFVKRDGDDRKTNT
jgi:DNA-binding CsgD family transcriptional regulator